MTDLTFRMGELFSGPGGMALGARRAAAAVSRGSRGTHRMSIEHVWANDFDLDTCLTYKRNILGRRSVLRSDASDLPEGVGAVIHQNVHDLDIHALGEIDGFAFGFPCNDYSLVGEWKGLDGHYGPLYSYGVEVLASHKPKWFVAENVSGLRGANEGRAFRQILDALQEPASGLRYRVVPHLYSFDEYGVPQRRQRIVMVGVRDDLGIEYRVPSPRLYDKVDVSVRSALAGMPGDLPNHEHAKLWPQVIERLSYIRPGENAFNAKLPEHLQLNVRGLTNSQVYKRLDPAKPSYTITGGGGGGTHVYHWDELRALTNRERARLQSFPDTFVFEGLKDSVRKQVGMAVPVKGAQAIFTALFRSFAGIPYRSIDANLSHLLNPSAPPKRFAA
jgi:DNA (cytosine-5)-methyltransferase 1